MKQSIKRVLLNFDVRVRTLLAERNYFLSENDRRLWSLKDKHKGQKAVIIGMGPSLRPDDLERFEDFVSFACNKIYLGFENTEWRPDYYSVIDSMVIENIREVLPKVEVDTKLFYRGEKRRLHEMQDSLFFRRWGVIFNESISQSPRYSSNPLEGIIGGGATVLLPLIQFAYWMGCDPVYVVGVDFSFKISEATGEKTRVGEEVLEGQGESNHFHPNYRPKGEKWTMPLFDKQVEGFRFARKAYEAGGRRLYNASRVSKLEELEKVDFDEIFPEKG